MKFIDFLAEITDIDIKKIKYSVSIDSILDSLAYLTIIAELDEVYGIDIPASKIIDIKTIEDLYKFTGGIFER